jgi:hypothetical protein
MAMATEPLVRQHPDNPPGLSGPPCGSAALVASNRVTGCSGFRGSFVRVLHSGDRDGVAAGFVSCGQDDVDFERRCVSRGEQFLGCAELLGAGEDLTGDARGGRVVGGSRGDSDFVLLQV